MAEIGAVRSRTAQANYLKVESKFEFLGLGFKDLDEEPGAQTKSTRYINDKSTSKSITGYEWQSGFNIDQIRSEKAIDYIMKIAEEQKIGSDAETDYVIVDMDKKVTGGTPTAEEYEARKFHIAIEVNKTGSDDGLMTGEGNFHGIGDVVIGTFDVKSLTFKAKK